MGIAVIAFVAIFLLIGTAGLLLFYRAGMARRLSAVINPKVEDVDQSRSKMELAGFSIKAVVEPFEKVLPKSPQEVSVVQKRLIRAGLREDTHVRILYGAKVLTPLGLCLLAGTSGAAEHFGSFFAYAVALGMGYLLPDFWLGRRISKRQEKIRVGLPDFLDLMVVCIEAGLSLDQALVRSAEELRASHPEISDEMGLLILEMRAGRPRVDAWKNLAERADIDVIRMLVSAIIQADQFGTSIAKTLRVYSDTLRVQRRQKVEEIAAKLAVKLVFPLVLFIFPSLFVVALGPAVIVMAESFSKYFH
ncbi:MAG: type II secretion system F family protein [Acidobacteriaceae bacterium]|nr:type II secretion system F family protein [Acidobacteriaceae bacterium]